MKKIKIAFISNNAVPFQLTWIKKLSENYEVRAYFSRDINRKQTPSYWKTPLPNNCKILKGIENPFFEEKLYSFGIEDELNEFNPDIVQLNGNWAMGLFWQSYLWASKNKKFIQINSGFNHLIRPMMYGVNHSIENISNTNDIERYYSVVGYICETDTFATNIKLKNVSTDDILCFKNAGAYCFSMSSNYNSRYKPAEVMLINNTYKLIREREKFENLLLNQIDIFN